MELRLEEDAESHVAHSFLSSCSMVFSNSVLSPKPTLDRPHLCGAIDEEGCGEADRPCHHGAHHVPQKLKSTTLPW